MSRINLEANQALRMRHTADQWSTLRLEMTGDFVCDLETPTFLFLDPGGATRSVYLPEKPLGGGLKFYITNNGSGTLEVRDDLGALVYTLASGFCATFICSWFEWIVIAVGTGAGLVDGDKGDIVVSGGASLFTIDDNVVTNAKLSDVLTATVKGRITSGTGDPEDLTGIQVTTLLSPFTDLLQGVVTASGGGTTNFLRADGSWAAPPGTGGAGAPSTAEYIVLSSDVTLLNERVITAGTNITLDSSVAGILTINSSGGAPTAAPYVTFGLDATLSNERVLTAGSNITLDTSVAGVLTVNASGGSGTLTINTTPISGSTANQLLYGDGTKLQQTAGISFSGSGALEFTDVTLFRDMGASMGLRSPFATRFDLYEEYNSASDYVLGFLDWQNNTRFRIGTEHLSEFNTHMSLEPNTGTTFLLTGPLGATGGTFATVANSPAQITGNQNDYNPGAKSYFQRWSSDASRDVTGMTFTEAMQAGEVHVIVNVGTNDIVLKHNVTSTAANRFQNASGADMTLTGGQMALALYDATVSGSFPAWRVTPWTGGGGSSYTDEQAQDAVGNILVDSTTIDFTYSDATPSITASVIAIPVANEAVDTTCFPLFVTAATGDLAPKTNAGLTFNSATGTFNSTVVTSGGVAVLTGLVVGTTPIGSGTTKRFLYDNGAILGETAGITFEGAGSLSAIGHLQLGTGSLSSVFSNKVAQIKESVSGDLSGPWVGIDLDITHNHTSGAAHFGAAASVFLSSTGAAGVDAVNGFLIEVASSHSSAVPIVLGTQSIAAHSGAGLVTSLVGLRASVGASGGGATNAFGLLLDTNTGTITNNYGIYIADHSSVGSATANNIHSVGGRNVFTGKSAFGSDALFPTMEGALPIEATIYVRNTFSGNMATAPNQPLHAGYWYVSDYEHTDNTNIATLMGMFVYPRVGSGSTGPFDEIIGIFTKPQYNGSGAVGLIEGVQADVFHTGSGTVFTIAAVAASVHIGQYLVTAGTVTNAHSFGTRLEMGENSACTNFMGFVLGPIDYASASTEQATITNYYGMFLSTPTNADVTVTNNYGVYIDPQTAGTTLNYNILSKGVGSLNVFEGTVNINTALNLTSEGMGQLISSSVGLVDSVDDLLSISFIFHGGGSPITTGVYGELEIPFACTIMRATLVADQTGSIVVDILKSSYATYPGSLASITAAALPTLSAAIQSQDSTLTGWTTTVAAGDVLRFSVSSASTVTRVTLALKVKKTY